MGADLRFGGGDKAEADPIAEQAGRGAQAQWQAVEQGVEQAGPAVELCQVLIEPGEVVHFSRRSLFHGKANPVAASRQGLALVERLGADLTAVIDPGQAGHMALLGGGQLAILQPFGGIAARGPGGAGQQGAQCLVQIADEAVDGTEAAAGRGLAHGLSPGIGAGAGAVNGSRFTVHGAVDDVPSLVAALPVDVSGALVGASLGIGDVFALSSNTTHSRSRRGELSIYPVC